MSYTYVTLTDLIGKTFNEVRQVEMHNDAIQFLGDQGDFALTHCQDCCESVYIEDINGDLNDLVGTPILVADNCSDIPDPEKLNEYDESFTWTFFRISTIKGTVVIRFYGSSNGYYSESAEIVAL
jgi:hypothetical protein